MTPHPPTPPEEERALADAFQLCTGCEDVADHPTFDEVACACHACIAHAFGLRDRALAAAEQRVATAIATERQWWLDRFNDDVPCVTTGGPTCEHESWAACVLAADARRAALQPTPPTGGRT